MCVGEDPGPVFGHGRVEVPMGHPRELSGYQWGLQAWAWKACGWYVNCWG